MSILDERPAPVIKGARLVTFERPDRTAYLREHSKEWYAKNRDWHNRRRKAAYDKQRSRGVGR